jgi:hypothetical protein
VKLTHLNPGHSHFSNLDSRTLLCDPIDPNDPAVSSPLQELLSLELYLAVEKGNPEWLELPDESHIFHKALYDGLNQALQQLYAEAGRVVPGPGEVGDRGVGPACPCTCLRHGWAPGACACTCS